MANKWNKSLPVTKKAPLTLEQRRELCNARITLNGQPGTIRGAQCDFAVVSDNNGRSFEWAWETVDRIVKNGGEFKV